MKVYIMLRTAPLRFVSEYVGVSSTRAGAEREFRKMYPHMYKDGDSYVSSKIGEPYILQIKEEVV